MMNREYIECVCDDISHVVRIDHVRRDGLEPPYLIIHNHLNPYLGFFKRVLVGVRYIFGHRTKYDAFDCTTVPEESARDLQKIVNDYLNELQENNT
jgi:hypothetical protein